MRTQVLGRNVIPGHWTFQIVEAYDHTYYRPFRELEQAAVEELADGRDHLYEAEMKEARRTAATRTTPPAPTPTPGDRRGRRMRRGPLSGRTAVVTGAARGIGAALARELAGRGMRVALLGHEGDRLRQLAGELPVPALAHEVDITDDAALAVAADAVRTGLGTPSVVVANAAVADAGLFADSDPARWRRVIDVNLTGSAATARTFLPDLTATRGYHLQVASLAAIGAAPLMSAYCASRRARRPSPTPCARRSPTSASPSASATSPGSAPT